MLVPRKIFPLGKLADKESSRYALGGVLLERDQDGRPIAIATDGRRLGYMTWSEDNPADLPAVGVDTRPDPWFSAIVPLDDWNQAAKSAKPKSAALADRARNVVIGEQSASGEKPALPIVATDGKQLSRLDSAPVEGRFPKWRDVIASVDVVSHETESPRVTSIDNRCAVKIAIDPAYLIDLLTIAGGLCDVGSAAVELIVPVDPHRAMYVHKRTDDAQFVGVLMPLAPDDSHSYFPRPGIELPACGSKPAPVLKAVDQAAPELPPDVDDQAEIDTELEEAPAP